MVKFILKALVSLVALSISLCDSAPSQPKVVVLPHDELIKNITANHTCNSDEDCSNNGICTIPTKVCECNNGYTTYIENYKNITSSEIENLKLCNYKQKSQAAAFLLSLFIGFGSEHFYLGNYDKAIAKLIFYLFCCLLNIFFFVIYRFFPKRHYLIEFIGEYEALYLSCGFAFMILWIIYDLVNIGKMDYYDGHLVKMSHNIYEKKVE